MRPAETRWRYADLGSALVLAQSGFACGADAPDGTVQLRMNNVTTVGTLDWSRLKRVPSKLVVKDKLFLSPGDVVFNSTNSPELVGKTALFPGFREPVTFSNHFLRLIPAPDIADGGYLSRWLSFQWQQGRFRTLCRQWVNQATVSRDRLLSMKIPLPPLKQQQRIARILDQAHGVREKRWAALTKLDSLSQSIFLDMFGDPVTNSKGWPNGVALGDVAEIASGITKGRVLRDDATRTVPYLAVLNVQDRSLDLKTVKTIDATISEIDRYRLRKGDLLLTEGGDPDKLGRGTLWNEEISECIHQNHVFRVRVMEKSVVDPLFLNWLIGSNRGKQYFLRSAKQTTGIASINMTQLKGFQMLIPPFSLQKQFGDRMVALQRMRIRMITHKEALNRLFASLQHRAFLGEL